MQETLGILAAMLSSSIGGTAIGATRYLAGHSDPLTIGAFRFGIGFVVLFPIALLESKPWPDKRDWPAVVGLGSISPGPFA